MKKKFSNFIQIKRSRYVTVMFFIFLAGTFGVSITSETSVDPLRKENRDLEVYVDSLKTVIEKIRMFETTVVATIYRPVVSQTDDTPHILADGTRIDPWNVSHKRYLAVSRDFLERWGGPFKFGDYIIVEDAGEHSGIWEIKDTMHPRWTRRIDFLVNRGIGNVKYDSVTVRKYKPRED